VSYVLIKLLEDEISAFSNPS
jgi:hypothetical protein